jgi:hypothetical protein
VGILLQFSVDSTTHLNWLNVKLQERNRIVSSVRDNMFQNQILFLVSSETQIDSFPYLTELQRRELRVQTVCFENRVTEA